MSSPQTTAFEIAMRALSFAWPLLSVVMLVAGILVLRARLQHAGIAIIVGAAVALMADLWRIMRSFFPVSGDVEIEKFHQGMMISQGISFVAYGIIAYGVLALALVVFRKYRDVPPDRSEF